MSSKKCACKGIRTCIQCENHGDETNQSKLSAENVGTCFVFCYKCKNLAWEGWNVSEVLASHPFHNGGNNFIHIQGVELLSNFISETEHDDLLKSIDKDTWVESQSGRLKQDFGPKVNFKKKKVKSCNFHGFPEYSDTILNKMKSEMILEDFNAVEMCNLDYSCDRGSGIDPHTDDSWLWGNRLVTVNLCSDTVLTLSYPRVKEDNVTRKTFCKFCIKDRFRSDWFNPNNCSIYVLCQAKERIQMSNCERPEEKFRVVVRIPMPRKSCLVLQDDPRYIWDHAILRQDVSDRRVGMTFRELSPLFTPGGEMSATGKELLEKANLRK